LSPYAHCPAPRRPQAGGRRLLLLVTLMHGSRFSRGSRLSERTAGGLRIAGALPLSGAARHLQGHLLEVSDRGAQSVSYLLLRCGGRAGYITADDRRRLAALFVAVRTRFGGVIPVVCGLPYHSSRSNAISRLRPRDLTIHTAAPRLLLRHDPHFWAHAHRRAAGGAGRAGLTADRPRVLRAGVRRCLRRVRD
jgi:hypothetical protein